MSATVAKSARVDAPPVTSRPRALFVGGTRYDIPLRSGLARKWDAVGGELDLRVIGRAGAVEAEDPRFRLFDAPGRLPSGVAFYPWLMRAVASEMRSFRPDLVITQSPYEAFACLPALRGPERPKLIVELHADWRTAARLYGSRTRRLYAGLSDRVAVYALRRADGTRALSPFTARIAEEATGRKPVASFTTYFDLESFTTEPPRPLPAERGIAWIGVLQRYKDPELLAKAWRLAAPQVPGARLTIVGRGPTQAVVDDLVREFPDRVEARPRLEPPEIARLLDRSTLLAMTSAAGSEGVPRVIMEAFVRGRPVVCTSVGGIPDVVEPEHNGLLVEPGDADQFAAALVRILTDRGLAERLAEGASEQARPARWSADSYAQSVREMVDRVLTDAR
jgi:glycosyltransferase involved in cell wall biosynthesis